MMAWELFIALNLLSALLQPSNTKLILACLFFPANWKCGLICWLSMVMFGFCAFKICQWVVSLP